MTPTRSFTQPTNKSTPTKNTENNNNSSINSINFSEIESPSLTTKFKKLKADAIQDEKRVNTRRIHRDKLPELENVSKAEKRVSNQGLKGIPSKKVHENSSENGSSYLKQAGDYVFSFLGENKKND